MSSDHSNNLDTAIQQFLDNGGEITRIKYGSEKDQNRARTLDFHRDKALNGSEKSRTILEYERVREEGMIFSRTDRLKE